MSLVTVIKDYFEIVHKIIETSPAYLVQHTTYTDSTTLYFYLINTFKNLFTDFFSFDFFQKIAVFPIIVPSIADSMISEISVLDGSFHNIFTFLDGPIFSAKNDSILITCFEKFFIGLFNSLFLWLPTCAATFLCLRRFVMQGMEIGYIAAIGTMTANIFWLICVLFGVRCIVIPWMSLDILRYWLGFMLLIKYFWDNRLPAKEIKSDVSINILKNKLGLKSIVDIFVQSFQFNGNNPIKQVFFFHFLLAFTEQTTLYPFISHFSLAAQSTYLESFPSNNFSDFLIIHCFYLLGIFIGSFSFINFICWFWEEPAYKIYLWATKNFQKIRVGDMVRITHFIFQTLTILLACASLPYFSIEYFITKPLGFLPNDQIFHQSQNQAFLTHSTSPVLYRSPYYFPRQRFFRYDDWAEYYGKNIPLDTSLYDQGAYRLYPIEDLHFGADYEWTRRRSNHVKIRSRMKRIMWFPRNWATQIWDLAKTWSRRNVAWRNEILSQYQNNWDSKSAPFWEQIVREELLFGKEKSKNDITNKSPWAASQNWSQKFLISGESFWWNWWSKNTNSDNKIWWNWILTKKNQIILDQNNPFTSDKADLNKRRLFNKNETNTDEGRNDSRIAKNMIFSNYQKLPSSYRLDYWLPQERLISLYSEQNQKQKNQLMYEIATLRKFVRKINKRVQINSNTQGRGGTTNTRLYTIFSINNGELYYNKFLFSNSFKSLINNLKNQFFSKTNQKDQLIIDSNKILNSLLNGYSLANQSYTFNKLNQMEKETDRSRLFDASLFDKSHPYSNILKTNSPILGPTDKQITPILSKQNNLFSNLSQQRFTPSSSLFLTLPAHYYLHTEQSFSRKLQFYGVRTSREFKPLNNAPIFNYYMKTYFHQYKPTRLYIANTKMKRDLGAGGRNRFKSRQYANKQLKKARILSKTPWIRQWISQSGFLTRRKRLESWIRYSHYNSNEIWGLILTADVDNFIKRQPSNHLLTNNEERLLHLRRFLLGEHFETLRWYSYMQHYRSMKVKIGGTKSFVNRMYNQQFKGTFHKVRHLFSLTPSLNGGGMLTFDQLLYNEFSNDNKNSIFNKELIHEELLSDKRENLNSFLVKDKKTQNFNFHFYSNDLIIKLSDMMKDYILEIMPTRQQFIQKLLKEKNFVDLTNLLASGWGKGELNKNFLINDISKRNNFFLNSIDFKEKSIRSSFSIDQQKKFQSMLILMFNKRRFLAKDYKRGSERLWKKWRKKHLIQKQIHKEKNIGVVVKDQPFILSKNLSKKYNPIEQNNLAFYRISNNTQKNDLYYKNLLKNNQQNTQEFSYQKQSIIRKALKDSIVIQKYFINNNILKTNIGNSGFPLIIKQKDFKKHLEFYNKNDDSTNRNIETMLGLKKNNFQLNLFNADKTVIKELINKIYKKIQIFNTIQNSVSLYPLTLDYWFKNIINGNKKTWHFLNQNPDSSINIKNRQEEIFNVLSYLQNKIIQQRLDINKKILTMKNYNQIDNKFFMIRASRHFKRARISQRKKLSQPIQKSKNFFHIERENIKKMNVFKMYKTFDLSIFPLIPITNFKGKKPTKTTSSSVLNNGLKNQQIYNKIIERGGIIESSNLDILNANQKKGISNIVFQNSKILNIFQPFLESLYYLPRLSTVWQSNLINTNIQPKIDMGSIYETKQYLTPIGVHKELLRQNFNAKNKIQDNIKRKLLDNHLNRFSERRRWNNQYQTINSEINEQLKKILEIIKQNQAILFTNKKILNQKFLFNKEKIKEIVIEYNQDYNFDHHNNNNKQAFFSLPLQKSIQNLNIKEIDELQLLSSIIDQKDYRQSSMNFSLLSFFHLKYLFNKYNKKSNVDFDKKQSVIFLNKNIFDKDQHHLQNPNYSNIKELITNHDKTSLSLLNHDFLDAMKFNNLILNYYPEIKKDKINEKKQVFTIFNQIQTKKTKTDDGEKLYFPKNTVSKTVQYYLIKSIQQKIEKQLQKLDNRLKVISLMTNKKEKNNHNSPSDSAQSSSNVLEKDDQILTTQKKLITKRIQFLTNLNFKLQAFYVQDEITPSLSIYNNTNEMKMNSKDEEVQSNSKRRINFIEVFGLKQTKKQYYFSKNTLNLLVEDCKNFIEYLNLNKEIYLEKQNKVVFDLLKSNVLPISDNGTKWSQEGINQFESASSIENSIELTTKIQKLLKKPLKHHLIKVDDNSKKFIERNQRFLKSQQSDNNLNPPFSIGSSVVTSLIKKQKLTNFEETLGSLLAIQKRGNPLSQKNIYYTKYKQKWNKNKLNVFSKSVSKRLNSQFADIPPSFKSNEKIFNLSTSGMAEQNGIDNFIGLRTWTRSKRSFNESNIPRNKKIFPDIFNSNLVSYNPTIFDKKTNPQQFLSLENFIKESILKPQRFEKQQSRKRLKFKKLPRQEHYKNLQFWDNYFKQKEDIKNKLFFDDLSLSFQKWTNFGFFPQKKVFQKQINNFYTQFNFFPSSSNSNLIYKENFKKSKKFSNFYDTNFKTITNLDIIKQIEYDNIIQKELNRVLNNDISQPNSNFLNNQAILQKEKNSTDFGIKGTANSEAYLQKHENEDIQSKSIRRISEEASLNSNPSFSKLDSKINQEQINYVDKDIIGKIYDKFFVKALEIDRSKIDKKFLIGINTFPFYAGWDESLRKFVITNRFLSRRDAGYNTNILFKDQPSDAKQFNIEFQQWPLQGRNAATTFFCHFPFITQPSDFSETIQYRNRTQLQQEDPLFEKPSEKIDFDNSNKFLEKNQKLSIKRIKKQKQEFRNENRRNITNLVGPNEIQNRRKAIFYPLKWRGLKSNTKKIIFKTKLQNNLNLFDDNNYTKTQFAKSLLKEKDKNFVGPLLSKFHLLRILRKGHTSKIRLTKLRSYKKYTKKENDILESSWRTFLSKRKLRSYDFVRQKNTRTMHLLKYQLGKKLQATKIQWLFRKNNSRANRQSENRKNKSGAHYLRPRKKSLRKRSIGIKYKRNQQISSINQFYPNKANLGIRRQQEQSDSSLKTNYNANYIKKKMISLPLKYGEITDLSNFNIIQEYPSLLQNEMKFYQTPFHWIRPNHSNNLYNRLFKTPYIHTPTLFSTLPGHGRFLPKAQTMPLPKSSVQTIKRAVRLANFEPASFIQREVLSYEWSMKQLIRNMNSRLNASSNKLIFKNANTNQTKQNQSPFDSSILMDRNASSVSIDLILQRHLRLFKKKLIHNPSIYSSSNSYLNQFSRQRTFQKRSIRLRKFNMTLAMNLYDRWFFYYYTGGKEDPLQNLFQSFEKLAQNISSSNNVNQAQSLNNPRVAIDNIDNLNNNVIFKSTRKFLTQKPDQKRSFNTFLTNLKTKKSSSFSKTLEISNEKQNIFNSTNLKDNSLKNDNMKNQPSFDSLIDEKLNETNSASLSQWWHLFQLFPKTVDGEAAQKEMLAKMSSNKKQKKQQEKDLEEDRYYFLKANKSPIIQDFRSSKSVNRHYPLTGGFIWPGDYLRLQTIMLPKEKKSKYFYNKNLVSEIKKGEKFKNNKIQKSMIDSNYKINEKIKEFQNFLLESK